LIEDRSFLGGLTLVFFDGIFARSIFETIEGGVAGLKVGMGSLVGDVEFGSCTKEELGPGGKPSAISFEKKMKEK
jgi:hypothetical protein